MAVFQYKIELLPFSDSQLFARILYERKADRGHTEIWNLQPAADSLVRLRTILPIENSWGPCEEFVSSTETWSSDLRIWHRDEERNYVERIAFRITAVGFSPELLSEIIRLAIEYGWFVGAVESECVYKPDVDCILTDFRASRAARFLEHPESVIIESAQQIDANSQRDV